MGRRVFVGADVFDGATMHAGAALVVEDGRVVAIGPEAAGERVELGGGVLAPGFVDLQVNGGGGVMLNDQPTLDLLTQRLTVHEQTAWMLRSLLED